MSKAKNAAPVSKAPSIFPSVGTSDVTSGMAKAMGDHADKLHPVKPGKLSDRGKPSPRMMQ